MHKFVKSNIAASIKKSLILLNVNALNAAFNVATLLTQKLIKTKDVNPINSQPSKNIIKFPVNNINTIETTNAKINNKSLVIKGSYLK